MGWKLVRDHNEKWCRANGVSGQWRTSPDARHNADVIRENTMLRDENSQLREEIARREVQR